MILFSVVTVVLNDLSGLKKTHRSVFEQVDAAFEWIVCDGGSGEETTGFLDSLGERVKWISAADRGIYDAMNKGVSMSRGAFVVFMNAGDTFDGSSALFKAKQVLSCVSPAIDVLFAGAMMRFPDNGRMLYRAPRTVEKSLWHGLPAIHQATFYRKRCLESAPYDLQYSLCGDYYIAATLVRNAAIVGYLHDSLAIFEVGGQSYQRPWQIFAEPYRIQRDILRLPVYYRLASILKRFVSISGVLFLSHAIFKKLGNKR